MSFEIAVQEAYAAVLNGCESVDLAAYESALVYDCLPRAVAMAVRNEIRNDSEKHKPFDHALVSEVKALCQAHRQRVAQEEKTASRRSTSSALSF
jgi:hypothetical protein